MSFKTFGDSNTVGVGASPSTLSWVGLFSPANQAVSGSQAAEVSNKALTNVTLSSDVSTVMIGTNDIRQYKDDATKKGYFEKFLRNALACLTLPSKLIARDMTASGTWSNTQANNIGRVSTQVGASLTGEVSGTKIYIGYIIQSAAAAVSAGDVYIDDVLVGSISCNGYTSPMNTVNGSAYATGCEVYDVAAGTHTVRIDVTTSGKNFYVDYVAGNDQTKATVLLSKVPKYSAAGYTYYGVTEAITANYNAIIAALATEFGAILVDNDTTINPAIHLADHVHLNNAGHAIAHDNFVAALP